MYVGEPGVTLAVGSVLWVDVIKVLDETLSVSVTLDDLEPDCV